jgi:hypothetical protein
MQKFHLAPSSITDCLRHMSLVYLIKSWANKTDLGPAVTNSKLQALFTQFGRGKRTEFGFDVGLIWACVCLVFPEFTLTKVKPTQSQKTLAQQKGRRKIQTQCNKNNEQSQ